MKRLLICLLVWSATLTVQAQGNFMRAGRELLSSSRTLTSKTVKSSQRQISKLLNQRVTRTYAQALEAEVKIENQSLLSALRSTQASVAVSPRIRADLAKELYPQAAELLTTDKQLSNYFVARNNREVMKNASSFVKHLQRQEAQAPLLQLHQRNYTHKAGLDPLWLAQQIPANTDYVLLGEVHDVEDIPLFIEEFLPALQEQIAPRPIIYLTEFLPEDMNFVDVAEFDDLLDMLSEDLISLWITATSFNIPVIGLDPSFVFFQTNESDLMRPSENPPFRKRHLQSIWSSDEGIRLRNERWEKQIHKVRQKNPDALIVLHAGFGHLSYVREYSIGSTLAQQASVYTVSLAPGYPANYRSSFIQDLQEYLPDFKLHPTPANGFPPYTYFDLATHGKFWQRIVQFAPQDRAITGFDVQIKVPAIVPEE